MQATSDPIKQSSSTGSRLIRIGHSPDPDDAFMWYPLTRSSSRGGQALIDTGPYQFEHVLEDIETLNQRCRRGELEVTALSIHQYPYVADKYVLTSCGSSMGDRYGPMIVSRKPLDVRDLAGVRIAVPGERTTALLALKLFMRDQGRDQGLGKGLRYEVIPFDQIMAAVVAGGFDAGLIIHEGQLTYADSGLRMVVDLGRWWTDRHGLPLPLGGNAIRRDLGGGAISEICTVLLRSIRYALDHRQEAVEYAMQFGRGMKRELADRFVGMYVNQWTLDYGPRGREAVRKLLDEAAEAGIAPACGRIDFAEPG